MIPADPEFGPGRELLARRHRIAGDNHLEPVAIHDLLRQGLERERKPRVSSTRITTATSDVTVVSA